MRCKLLLRPVVLLKQGPMWLRLEEAERHRCSHDLDVAKSLWRPDVYEIWCGKLEIDFEIVVRRMVRGLKER